MGTLEGLSRMRSGLLLLLSCCCGGCFCVCGCSGAGRELTEVAAERGSGAGYEGGNKSVFEVGGDDEEPAASLSCTCCTAIVVKDRVGLGTDGEGSAAAGLGGE